MLGGHSEWVAIEGADDATASRLRFWAMAAIRALDVDIEHITVEVCSDGRLDDGVRVATDGARVLVSPELAVPGDDIREAQLAYTLCRSIAELTVMRLGFESEGFGTFLIELAGACA